MLQAHVQFRNSRVTKQRETEREGVSLIASDDWILVSLNE